MTRAERLSPAAWSACAAILLALGAIVMIQPVFQQIAADFALPVTDIRVSFSYCSLAYAVSFFLLGPLTDRYSLTRMALCAALGLTLSVTACGLASSFALFNLGMVAMGAFAAGLVSPMFPYMARIAPAGKAGAYLGLCLSATVTGLILGRTALGVLTGWLGWRWAMLGYALPVALLAFVIARMPPLPSVQKSRSSLADQYADALKLLALAPVIRRYLAGFLLFFAYLGSLTMLTFYLGKPPFELTVAQIGWISLAGLGGAVIAPKAGALAQAYGAGKVVRSGVTLVLAAFALMFAVANVPAVVLGVLILYTGVYACQPAVFYDVTTNISPQQIGSASSLYLLSCLSGGSLGSYALGPIWQRWGWTGVMLASGVATLGTLLLATVVDARSQLVRSAA